MSFLKLAVATFGFPLGTAYDGIFHDVDTHLRDSRVTPPDGPSLFYRTCFTCGLIQIGVVAAVATFLAIN